MYIEYKGQLYHLITSIFTDNKPALTTHFKEKTDNTFYKVADYFAKELKPNDANVQNIYEVDFYVVYRDTSETVMKRAAELKKYVEKGDCRISNDEFDAVFRHIWCVNGGAPILNSPKIENNEVEIILSGNSCSEDWIVFERGWCYKAVNIYDCEKLLVRYTYSVRDGKKLAKKETVEATMKPEEFKAEKLKYVIGNI